MVVRWQHKVRDSHTGHDCESVNRNDSNLVQMSAEIGLLFYALQVLRVDRGRLSLTLAGSVTRNASFNGTTGRLSRKWCLAINAYRAWPSFNGAFQGLGLTCGSTS